jgi:hypothetical protein
MSTISEMVAGITRGATSPVALVEEALAAANGRCSLGTDFGQVRLATALPVRRRR